MNSAGKRYMVEFGGAMLAYMVVLVLSILIIHRIPDSPWRVLVALAPVVPAFFGLLAFVRFLGRADELQRQIQLEAIAFGAGATALSTFAYGFLENVGFPHLSFIYVLPLLCIFWGIGAAIAARKYR